MAAGNAEAAYAADHRATALRASAARLRDALDRHPASLTDRAVAQRELVVLERLAGTAGPLDVGALRHALLLIAGAVGSVRALAPELKELRAAVELFDAPRQRVPAARSATAG